MLFTDEDSQHSYHKAPLLLQVVCQVFESHAAAHGLQVELIDCDRNAGLWIAALATTHQISDDVAEHLVHLTNQTFKRKDALKTCLLENSDVSLFSIRVSETADYAQAH